jgi:hypothetical protein
MAKRELPKRMFKERDRVSSYHQPSRSPGKLMKHMSRDHFDVLQNIEFTLVRRWREDREIDDSVVSAALRASLKNVTAEQPLVAGLVEDLKSVREMRADVSADVWHDALRVVDDSVHNHSQLRPGETSYLSFASRYLP